MRWLISMGVLFIVASCSDLNPLHAGDRCNPNRNPPPADQECGGGLVCTVPANCTTAVCCPADPTTAPPGMVVAACNACPPPADAGAE